MKEDQNDISYIAGENIAVVSSSPFEENLRKKGLEELHVADPMDEYAIHQPKEFDGKMLKSTTKEELDLGDEDEKRMLKELKAEFESLAELTKGVPGDKAEEAIVDDRTVDSLRVFTTSGHGLPVDMERVMKAQAPVGLERQQHSSQQQQQPQTARQPTRQEREKEKGERKKERKEKEEREAEEGRGEQVEEDVTGWTEVTRRRRRKMILIFVRVNGTKATPMEVNLTDDRVEDVMRRIQNDEDAYVTLHGRVLRRGEKLRSCEVTDGCTVQATSRLRGGGKHKDKKGQKERKRAVKPKGPEQKSEEEPKRDRGPAIQECDRDAAVQMIEESEENRKMMVRMLEENEDNRKMIESICEGSDVEVEEALQNYRTAGREVLGWDQGQADLMERGLRWAVEARRKERREEHKQRRQEEQELGEEEGPLEEMRAESTDEP